MDRQYAGVIAIHQGRIALVREHFPAWGAPHWNVPSGRVEPPETPAAAAARELSEETGLTVAPHDLTLISTCQIGTASGPYRSWNYTATVHHDDLAVADPDGNVHWLFHAPDQPGVSHLPVAGQDGQPRP